jgi:hypothetical protein
MMSNENCYAPIYLVRIHPRPTFETIAAFTNIKFLCLNAAAVCESRFHQIEGIVKKTVQTCKQLERVEVTSDIASVAWRDARETTDVSGEDNYRWVARLNQGMRITAKLMVVDSLGLSWPWFWQAPERKTLDWAEKVEKLTAVGGL